VLTLPIFDERAIWLVPFAFYIYDSVCLLDDRHIIVLENHRLRWTFRLSKIPFVFSGKHLYLLPPLLPFIFAFNLPWLIVDQGNNYKVNRCNRKLLIWRSKLCEFRAIAVCSWINLFLIGPIMTNVGGFLFALKCVLPFHFVLLIWCIFLFFGNSYLLHFSRRMILSYLLELTLSPGYLPNICRRLSLNCACEVDGVLFVKRYGQRSTVESMIDVVQFRLLEMKSEANDNLGSIRELEGYSAELRL
jgi:hypothetical protein